jgi:hypothetical protein
MLSSKPACAQESQKSRPVGSNPIPEPAINGIITAFDKYEVVGMEAAHEQKDVDDLTLSLIRDPRFSEKVNDIVVECGNSLYQPGLDRYIAGEDVPFAEVRKVWRNTAQPMCSKSGFYEQLFPLVRAINQKLRAGKRLRVLAGDPPRDWDQIKSRQDFPKGVSRDANIASVMMKEVLSKHRKALMLFGIFHLVHISDPRFASAVTIYEKDYPNLTFVISDLGTFGTDSPDMFSGPLASWPIPSLVRTKGTWLGALDLSHFFPPPITIDKDCGVHLEMTKDLETPTQDLVDAFVYLGPPDLRLKEQMPADIALDVDYMAELQRRAALLGYPGANLTQNEFSRQIVNSAEDPLLGFKQPDTKPMVQGCLDLKARSKPAQ